MNDEASLSSTPAEHKRNLQTKDDISVHSSRNTTSNETAPTKTKLPAALTITKSPNKPPLTWNSAIPTAMTTTTTSSSQRNRSWSSGDKDEVNHSNEDLKALLRDLPAIPSTLEIPEKVF